MFCRKSAREVIEKIFFNSRYGISATHSTTPTTVQHKPSPKDRTVAKITKTTNRFVKYIEYYNNIIKVLKTIKLLLTIIKFFKNLTFYCITYYKIAIYIYFNNSIEIIGNNLSTIVFFLSTNNIIY